MQACPGVHGGPFFRDAAANDGAEMDRSRVGRCARCAMNSAGYFEIGFSRQKETGVEIDFSEKFEWSPPSVNVAVDFWADEAVELYWISNVSACPCSR
jgi:hypothetical protein